MFSMIRVSEIILIEYGWRNSFVFCAGFSLQICVLGALIFPLKPLKMDDCSTGEDAEEAKEKCLSEESLAISPLPLGKILLYRKSLLNRSVSSLRLSIGGGYLSSSLANIDGDLKSGHGTFSSNQHSFSSRGSQYLGSGMRSNQHSFSQFPYGDYPVGLLPFLRSNQHSFCSRGSSYGIHSLRSNPQSFSNKNSQVDLPHTAYHHCLPALKDSTSELSASKDLKEESLSASEFKLAFSGILKKYDAEPTSRCNLLFKKVKSAVTGIISGWCLDLFLQPCFLLLNIAVFFTMLGTIKIFVIYKDFSEELGVGDYYSSAMSVMGIGDICGRLSAGVLASCSWSNPTVLYAIALILCGIVVCLHSVAQWGPIFLLVAGLFGFCYGLQNVLITLSPTSLFGKEKMVTVFGNVLFFGGFGALIGAPLAGYIVDCTGSYNGVIILSVASCTVAGICMICCYLISKRESSAHLQEVISHFV